MPAHIATDLAQNTVEAASAKSWAVADHSRPKVPTVATNRDNAGHDVVANILRLLSPLNCLSDNTLLPADRGRLPKQHRPKLHSASPIECLNGETGPGPEWSAFCPTTTPVSLSLARCSRNTFGWRTQRAGHIGLKTMEPMGYHPALASCKPWHPPKQTRVEHQGNDQRRLPPRRQDNSKRWCGRPLAASMCQGGGC